MGSIWVLSAPDGPHVVPMNLAIRDQMKTVSVSVSRGEHISLSVQDQVGANETNWHAGTKTGTISAWCRDICCWGVQGQHLPLWFLLSWMQQSTSLTTTRQKTRAITVMEAGRGLISNYHVRPVLMVPVLVSVCQHSAVGALCDTPVTIGISLRESPGPEENPKIISTVTCQN